MGVREQEGKRNDGVGIMCVEFKLGSLAGHSRMGTFPLAAQGPGIPVCLCRNAHQPFYHFIFLFIITHCHIPFFCKKKKRKKIEEKKKNATAAWF